MLSGASAQNKGVYLAELISRVCSSIDYVLVLVSLLLSFSLPDTDSSSVCMQYLADKLGLGQSLASLSRAPERGAANDPEPFSYSPRVSPGALASVASHVRSALARLVSSSHVDNLLPIVVGI